MRSLPRRRLGEGPDVACGVGEVAKLFAHIGLKTIDVVAGERHGRTYMDYKAGAVSLPVSEAQVQMLLARFCLVTRLNYDGIYV